MREDLVLHTLVMLLDTSPHSPHLANLGKYWLRLVFACVNGERLGLRENVEIFWERLFVTHVNGERKVGR